MVKKAQSKKNSAKKLKVTPVKASKTVSKKAAKKPIKKASKPTIVTSNKPAYRDLLYGLASALMVYVFALWAIDSGSLWVYAFTFTALYFTIHYFRLFIKNKFFKNNDKTRKTR
jgi:hypothetical protein